MRKCLLTVQTQLTLEVKMTGVLFLMIMSLATGLVFFGTVGSIAGSFLCTIHMNLLQLIILFPVAFLASLWCFQISERSWLGYIDKSRRYGKKHSDGSIEYMDGGGTRQQDGIVSSLVQLALTSVLFSLLMDLISWSPVFSTIQFGFNNFRLTMFFWGGCGFSLALPMYINLGIQVMRYFSMISREFGKQVG